MDAKNAIDEILRDACGNRASGREMLVRPKQAYLTPEAASVLKEQWQSAGRDNANVVMMLSEEDGTNPHFVTGWNGKDTFVCLTDTGLTYVDQRKLEQMKVHEQWNPATRLIELRAHQITEDMERSDVDQLLDRIKRTLTKSGKIRRKGRLRNMEKFFAAAVVESESSSKKKRQSTPFSGPLKGSSGTEFETVDEKDDRIPKGLDCGESTDWDRLDGDGRPVRRGLNHPRMRMEGNTTDPQIEKRELVHQDSEGGGSAGGATPGGNKTDSQLALRRQIDVRSEDHQAAELDKRELVDVDSEVGGGGTGATPGGNKTDVQLRIRQLVRMDRESGGSTVHKEQAQDSSSDAEDDDYTDYAGQKGKSKEFGSRPKIAVRHEALSLKKGAKALFGPKADKKSPEGAKKPLLMLVLMGKKKPMSEDNRNFTCPDCGHTEGPPMGPSGGLIPKGNCPSGVCSKKRAGDEKRKRMDMLRQKRGAMQPPSQHSFESRYGRSRLNMAESKKRKLHPSFLANIEKMKAKAGERVERVEEGTWKPGQARELYTHMSKLARTHGDPKIRGRGTEVAAHLTRKARVSDTNTQQHGLEGLVGKDSARRQALAHARSMPHGSRDPRPRSGDPDSPPRSGGYDSGEFHGRSQ